MQFFSLATKLNLDWILQEQHTTGFMKSLCFIGVIMKQTAWHIDTTPHFSEPPFHSPLQGPSLPFSFAPRSQSGAQAHLHDGESDNRRLKGLDGFGICCLLLCSLLALTLRIGGLISSLCIAWKRRCSSLKILNFAMNIHLQAPPQRPQVSYSNFRTPHPLCQNITPKGHKINRICAID